MNIKHAKDYAIAKKIVQDWKLSDSRWFGRRDRRGSLRACPSHHRFMCYGDWEDAYTTGKRFLSFSKPGSVGGSIIFGLIN